MVAYYNEIDVGAANWLKSLIKNKQLPDGDVDTRSIIDVRSDDLRGYDQCHFFAGIGGWAVALQQAGWGERNVFTGSCPCQPFSNAGSGRGFDDERHLWKHFYRLIRERRPNTIFGEQVASKIALEWIDGVQTDLENEGYAVGTLDLCAASVNAPHVRQRLYWVANAETWGWRKEQSNSKWLLEGANSSQHETGRLSTSGAVNNFWCDAEWIECYDNKYRAVEPRIQPVVNGVSNRLVKLRGYGNAIVVPLAKQFIEAYLEILEDQTNATLS